MDCLKCGIPVDKGQYETEGKVKTVYGCISFPLTSKDIQVLKNTWPVVKEYWIKICTTTFKTWFSMYPELRYIFKHLPQPSELTSEELLKSNAMKLHVKKVEEVVELALSKIHDLEDFVTTVIELGIAHHSLGAHPKYSTSLAQCLLLGVTTNVQCDATVEYAWDSLFRFIMDCLKFGMRKEREKHGLEYDSTAEYFTQISTFIPTNTT